MIFRMNWTADFRCGGAQIYVRISSSWIIESKSKKFVDYKIIANDVLAKKFASFSECIIVKEMCVAIRLVLVHVDSCKNESMSAGTDCHSSLCKFFFSTKVQASIIKTVSANRIGTWCWFLVSSNIFLTSMQLS